MTNLARDKTDEQWRAWTRDHRVSYEVRPLSQMQGTSMVQIGFEVELAASLPGPEEGSEARRQDMRDEMTTLTGLILKVFPDTNDATRFELAPLQAVAQLRPETGHHPELRRSVKVYHRQDAASSVEAGDRQRLAPFEQRLKELGVKPGSWGAGG